MGPEFSTRLAQLPAVIGFGAAFLVLTIALGRRALIWLGVSALGVTPPERALVAAALGTGILQAIPITLGAFGVLRPSPLKSAVLAAIVLLMPDLYCVAKGGLRWAGDRRPLPAWLKLWAIALVPGLIPLSLLALAPTIDNDGLIYHLTVPKRWLNGGSLNYLPSYPYSNTPMGVQTLFGIALVFCGDVAAKLLNLQSAILGVAGIYLAAARLDARWSGAATATMALALFGTPSSTLGSAYIEGFLVLTMGSASLAWLIWNETRSAGWLRSAMVLAGLSVSFKITCANFALGLAVLTVAASLEPAQFRTAPKRPIGALAARVLGLIVLALLPVAPWIIRAGTLTGNPFFPMFAGHLPTRDLHGESAAFFASAMRYANWGARFEASLQTRKLVVIGVALVLTLSMLLACGLWWKSFRGRSAALAVLTAALLQLWTVGLNTRLWVPLLTIFAIPAMAAMRGGFVNRKVSTLRAGQSRAPTILVGIALVCSALLTRRVESEIKLPKLAQTLMSDQARRGILLEVRPMYSAIEWANAHLPPDARVLLVFCPAGFYLDRATFVNDFVQDAVRFKSVEGLFSDLHALGVTHVIRATTLGDQMDPFIDRKLHFELTQRMVRQHARVLIRLGNTEVDELGADASNRELSTAP